MKTAISLPDELFREADKLAQRLGISRSELFRKALEDYVSLHDADRVREALDRVIAEVGLADDEFVRRAAAKVLSNVEW